MTTDLGVVVMSARAVDDVHAFSGGFIFADMPVILPKTEWRV
jgi:hypothetical protein